MSKLQRRIPCVGCGALVPDSSGPTHRYIGASPGCWEIYGEVLAREYSDIRYSTVHRITVDAYAAQHPGAPSPQSIQSVAVHLISLHWVVEQNLAPERALGVIRRAVSRKRTYHWLEPPSSLGDVTVLDVHSARDFVRHKDAVRRWARSVWLAWAPHHEKLRRWAEAAGGP